MQSVYNRIPLGFTNLISLVASMGTIVVWIMAIVQRILRKDVSFVIVLLAIMLAMVVLVAKLVKYRKIAYSRLALFSTKTEQFNRDFKELYIGMVESYKQGRKESLTMLIDEYMLKRLNELAALFEEITEKRVHACIKILTGTENKIFDYADIEVTTFARSSNSGSTRSDRDAKTDIKHLIKQNTDFDQIVGDNRSNLQSYMWIPDIPKLAKELSESGSEYKNTNTDWMKHYRSTIIVPIRMELKKVCAQNEGHTYHIIGFLCVDSMSTKAFLKKQVAFYVKLLGGYADHIYMVFNHYTHYMEKLKKEGK